jgi:hypothetical protein
VHLPKDYPKITTVGDFHPRASTRAMRNGRIAFQAIYGAPMFMGFDYMEIADGRQKLAGFISSCR